MQSPYSPSLFPQLNITDPLNRHFRVRKTQKNIPFNIYADDEEEDYIPPNRVRSPLQLSSPSPPRRTQKRKLSQVNNNNNNHNNHNNHNFNNNEDKNYEAELNKLQEAEILKITKAYKKQIRSIKKKYENKRQTYYTKKLNSNMLLSGKFPSKLNKS